MSATVTYAGDTITTVENETKTLTTAGKWLTSDISITDVTSGGSTSTRSIVLYDNSATITADPDINYIWINNQPELITVGDNYRVTFDGVVYNTTAVNDSIIYSQYGTTFGNPSVLWGNDDGSNAPFCVFKASWNNNEMVVSTTYPAGTVNLKIEKIVASGGGGTPNLQAKTNITPTTSSQTIQPDSGYDGLSSVQINAIPSNYIVPTGSLNITSNNTYDVTQYASAVVNVSGASGFKTGTITVPADWTSAANRQIVTLSTIGFTPKRFYLLLADKAAASGKQYTILRASFETDNNNGYLRTVIRYSNTSNSLGANQNTGNWTTQTNYHLYKDSTAIYYRTTTGYNMFKDSVYIWIAVE